MAVHVRISRLSKRYGAVTALEDVSIDVQPGEFFFLIGPSGCGKTTLLRAVAGFVEPDRGEIHFDDRLMNEVPPHKRNTALVFQGYALWPHMTVEQNVEYGLRVRGIASAERSARVAEILDVVHLKGLENRFPNELSGGQQQRVALARAIVVEPHVLLFDEPLSNLDAQLRIEMRREILRIHERTGITAIYVTHDQKEALSMAERIAILDNGRIVQTGSPEECYRRPRSRFVAQFLGEANFVDGVVIGAGRDREVEVETAIGRLRVDVPNEDAATPEKGQPVCCCFRPESLRLLRGEPDDSVNRLRAKVVNVTYLGETLEFELSAGDEGQAVRATLFGGRNTPSRGTEIDLVVSPSDIVLL